MKNRQKASILWFGGDGDLKEAKVISHGMRKTVSGTLIHKAMKLSPKPNLFSLRIAAKKFLITKSGDFTKEEFSTGIFVNARETFVK